MISRGPFLPTLFHDHVIPHDCQKKLVSHTLIKAFLLSVTSKDCNQKQENKLRQIILTRSVSMIFCRLPRLLFTSLFCNVFSYADTLKKIKYPCRPF